MLVDGAPGPFLIHCVYGPAGIWAAPVSYRAKSRPPSTYLQSVRWSVQPTDSGAFWSLCCPAPDLVTRESLCPSKVMR